MLVERRGAGRWRCIELNDGTPAGPVPVRPNVTAEAEALARSYAEPSPSAIQLLMASVREVVEEGQTSLHYTEHRIDACTILCSGPSVPLWVRLPTGEPDAGDLHVRFGGRGRRDASPYPYRQD